MYIKSRSGGIISWKVYHIFVQNHEYEQVPCFCNQKVIISPPMLCILPILLVRLRYLVSDHLIYVNLTFLPHHFNIFFAFPILLSYSLYVSHGDSFHLSSTWYTCPHEARTLDEGGILGTRCSQMKWHPGSPQGAFKASRYRRRYNSIATSHFASACLLETLFIMDRQKSLSVASCAALYHLAPVTIAEAFAENLDRCLITGPEL